MIPRVVDLSHREHRIFRVARAFLLNRLAERETIEWAVQLDISRQAERVAIGDILDHPQNKPLKEPWASAWSWILEAWGSPETPSDVLRTYTIRENIKRGDRTGALIDRVVGLVRPSVEVAVNRPWLVEQKTRRSRPRRARDFIDVKLTSGRTLDPKEIALEEILESAFLVELANTLEAAVVKGLDIGRRLGCKGDGELWRLGSLYRVQYLSLQESGTNSAEPDKYHTGIAPSAKLLHAAVSRLGEVDAAGAQRILKRWMGDRQSPLHVRLWAALASDERLVSRDEVAEYFRECSNDEFWRRHAYPEVALLRAKWFSRLSPSDQSAILRRLERLPPRKYWPRDIERSQLDRARIVLAAQELRRIELGSDRPNTSDAPILTRELAASSDLLAMTRLDEHLPERLRGGRVPPDPDRRFDTLEGAKRLRALEQALRSSADWHGSSSGRARDWLRQTGSAQRVLSDLEISPGAGADYPSVWNAFGWECRLDSTPEEVDATSSKKNGVTGERVLVLLGELPEDTARNAIEGISHWLATWAKVATQSSLLHDAWLRLWPLAVEATDAQQPVGEPPVLDVMASADDDDPPLDLDTLNTPSGKLVGVFLTGCPTIREGDRPFEVDAELQVKRDRIIDTSGRSGLIARHRMIEDLPWFLQADEDWTRRNLMAPLLDDGPDSVALWNAVAHTTIFPPVLGEIGEAVVRRANDRRLGRHTRERLLFSLVVEALHSLREARDPDIAFPEIQQAIRVAEDEVRAHAASVVRRFVVDLTKKFVDSDSEALDITPILGAVETFLTEVWPQERSLATPGVAKAFADLPAACVNDFASIVGHVERFLVPFQCWSMLDFGLGGKRDDFIELSSIDTPEKADALLHLLDLTIGSRADSVIPHGLGEALEQVRMVAPRITGGRRYRRLATLARRRG